MQFVARRREYGADLGRLGAVTPIYASAQRLMGAEPSEGDDIYSVGVMTYLIVTGQRTFRTANALEAKTNGISLALPGACRSANALRSKTPCRRVTADCHWTHRPSISRINSSSHWSP
ncbi:hypothetical protein DTW90_31785 [Neorhizobium sp. P12A]|nr:hypothetical protein DTW90_31785 [Neorhizobium sp. P12A]